MCKHLSTKIHTFISCGGEVTEYIKCVACGYSQKARVIGQQVSNDDIGIRERTHKRC